MLNKILISEKKFHRLFQEAIEDLSWQEHAKKAKEHERKGDEAGGLLFSKNGGPTSDWEKEQAKKEYDTANQHRKASAEKWKKEKKSNDRYAYQDDLANLDDKECREAIVHAVTENIIRMLNESDDPFEGQNWINQRNIQSYKEGLFDGLGLEPYFEWKIKGGNVPKMTEQEAHKALSLLSDKMDELWDSDENSDLYGQMEYIEDEMDHLLMGGFFQ